MATYTITKSIDTHFAHVVRGHSGLCNGIHGHTWKFEVTLKSDRLDNEGFVCDFGRLKKSVLTPLDLLLDHSFAMFARDWDALQEPLTAIGDYFQNVRASVHGMSDANGMMYECVRKSACVALRNANVTWAGSNKCVLFDFVPTSERLAQWLYDITDDAMRSDHVSVDVARVYETMQPVNSYATYSP